MYNSRSFTQAWALYVSGSQMSADLELTLDELFSTPPPLVVNTSSKDTGDLVLESVALAECDVAELQALGPSRSYATVQHTRAYHHIAALRLASGEKAGVVARSLNLEAQTLSRLQKDPQFMDLVEGYRTEFVDQAVSTFQLMELISMEAASAIHERLIGGERDTIPLEALRRIGETFADRTGHSPVRRSESLNVSASGSIADVTLQRVKDRHGEDALYQSPVSQPALEEGHAQEALDQGAKGSIAAVFESVEEKQVVVTSSEGAGI
jgi:hypothetical protein